MRAAPALLVAAALAAAALSPGAGARAASPRLPDGFVYLAEVAPSIVQDIRYAGPHNPVGRPLPGYGAATCILTRRAAQALAQVQSAVEDAGMTLRVYDCYRPERAVRAMVAWANDPRDRAMKAEYYPRVEKSQLVALGYVDAHSSHARGSAVDVTLERLPMIAPQPWSPGDPLRSCIAPFFGRYRDGSLDMGTEVNCLDALSHEKADVGNVAQSHRNVLRQLMTEHGFVQLPQEWWHYALRDEPFPKRTFDFPIAAP